MTTNELIIKAKSFKTILSKLKRKEAELQAVNGRLANQINIKDIEDLYKCYTEQAKRIKTYGVNIKECYRALCVTISAWWGDLPKAYKYKKEFTSAKMWMDNDGNFSLRIFRDECRAGMGQYHRTVWINDTDMIKKNHIYIINKLLEE